MTTHKLKTWPEPFEAIAQGKKKFEFRRGDRDFGVGDCLLLCEHTEPNREFIGFFTGREIVARVTYMVSGPMFGVPLGFVCMSIDVDASYDLHAPKAPPDPPLPDPPLPMLLMCPACGERHIDRQAQDPRAPRWVRD